VEIGWDVDHRNNQFYTLCEVHEPTADEFFIKNMKWEEKQAAIGYED